MVDSSFRDARASLRAIIKRALEGQETRNEAQTRFDLIDDLLLLLQWDKGSEIKVEQYEAGQRTDYELGSPRCAIWEAKREADWFSIPAGYSDRCIVDLGSLCSYADNLEKAVSQAQEYCSNRGVALAVVTNGNQHVVFMATRSDGLPPLEGKCAFFESLKDTEENFDLFWDLLSRSGVHEQRYRRYLTGANNRRKPPKLTSILPEYPKYRYPSNVQTTLRTIGDLLIHDIPANQEEEFFRKCYCSSGALSQETLLSKEILRTRYAALFSSSEHQPSIESANPKSNDSPFLDRVKSEALNQRPIVLLGDVGVGKTSFLKNLVHVEASEIIRESIYLYIDFGSKGTLAKDLKSFVLKEIENQLFEKYEVNCDEESFVKGVYASEIARFKSGIKGQWSANDGDLKSRLLEHLEENLNDKEQHLRRSLEHLSKGRHKQIVIFLDNADQRDDETQQSAFLMAQDFAANWSATVFLALRPNTFFRSRRSGALSAYPHRVFVVQPPRVEEVIKKRLVYGIEIAEGDSHPVLSQISMNVPSVIAIMRTLVSSITKSRDIREFLINITGGNVRFAIEFIKGFIGSPNVDHEKIIGFYERKEPYVIPLHEFTKQALLGDFSYFDPKSSTALNLYDVPIGGFREHFLMPFLLAFLLSESTDADENNFFSTKLIISELIACEFGVDGVEHALRSATNKKLIETSNRVTFEESEDGLFGELPGSFRVTSIGAYHFHRWATAFAYLDAVLIDTPIFDDAAREEIASYVQSFDIASRYKRSLRFRSYLISCWNDANFPLRLLDFENLIRLNDASFKSVQSFLSKQN